MNCDETDERLAEELGGELGAAGRAELEAHLRDCSECRREAESLRGVVAALGELPGVTPEEAAERARGAASRAAARAAGVVWRRRAGVVLRYAAALLVGALAARGWGGGAGWAGAAGAGTQGSANLPSPRPSPAAAGEGDPARAGVAVHPGWLRAARAVGALPTGAAGAGGGFAEPLALLAQAGRRR
ncbi:MAG: zf-HC2 domain-containing protein [Planctomycetes bacterium]|nr:zf-HC2 domain-containing protein [Planctomycetota bacterium]